MMNLTEKYLNSNATYSSMVKLVQELKEEEEVKEICRNHGLNVNLLESLFNLAMKGYNNTEIAERLGANRVTVQRYAAALKKLKESEFKKVRNFVFKIKNEKNN